MIATQEIRKDLGVGQIRLPFGIRDEEVTGPGVVGRGPETNSEADRISIMGVESVESA